MSTPQHAVGQMSVTLGEKTYTLFFDYVFLSILQTLFDGKDFQEAMQQDPYRLLPVITLAAIRSGDDVNEGADALTERQISRLLFAAGSDVNKAIFDNYTASMGFIGAVYAQTVNVVNAVDEAKSTK